MLVYPKLSYEVMNVMFSVHNQIGSGLLEKHYQRAIEIELKKREMFFEREKMVRLTYQGKTIGKYYLDFVINQAIVIEVKTTPAFQQNSLRQAYSYLKELHLPLAIVVNFHAPQLRYQRIVNPAFKHVILSQY